MKFNTSLNPLDISGILKKVFHYSGIILKKSIGVIKDMKYFIKEFALSLFKYFHVFIIVSISLLGVTLLFSKNKLGNLLILSYLILVAFVFGLVIAILALVGVCIEKTILLFKKILELIKIEKKISVKCIINIIFVFLAILLFGIEFAFVLGFLTFLAIIVDYIFGVLTKIFNTINGVYSKTSLLAQTTTTAVDSFGTMIRKGFENCD
jgi:hypothetical protein